MKFRSLLVGLSLVVGSGIGCSESSVAPPPAPVQIPWQPLVLENGQFAVQMPGAFREWDTQIESQPVKMWSGYHDELSYEIYRLPVKEMPGDSQFEREKFFQARLAVKHFPHDERRLLKVREDYRAGPAHVYEVLEALHLPNQGNGQRRTRYVLFPGSLYWCVVSAPGNRLQEPAVQQFFESLKIVSSP